MLLNELKQIFEVSLEGALSDLGIHTHRSGGSGGRDTGGDVDASLKNVIERCVVTAQYIAPTTQEVNELTESDEAKEKTIQGLGNLAGTLRRLQAGFTTELSEIASEIGVVAGDVKFTVWLADMVKDLNQPASPLATQLFEATKATLQTKRENITRTLMRLANSESYARATADEIKNFTRSQEWLEDDKKTVNSTGPTKLRNLIQRFYAVVVTLQKNTKSLTTNITAAIEKTPKPKA